MAEQRRNPARHDGWWQTEEESQFQRSNSQIRSQINNEVGYNTEDLIEENGNRMKAIDVAKAVQRQIKDEAEAEEARGDADEASAPGHGQSAANLT